jgi:cell division protein ZapA
MSEQPVIRVQIFGTEYSIYTEGDPDHARAVARNVDRKMRDVANYISLRSVAKIAVVAAVNLAHELLKEEEASRKLGKTLTEQTHNLASFTNRIA